MQKHCALLLWLPVKYRLCVLLALATANTDVAVTELAAADNAIPEAATGGDTTAMTVDTTVEGGRVVSCVVRDVPNAQYSAGVEFNIDGHRWLHRLCNYDSLELCSL